MVYIIEILINLSVAASMMSVILLCAFIILSGDALMLMYDAEVSPKRLKHIKRVFIALIITSIICICIPRKALKKEYIIETTTIETTK